MALKHFKTFPLLEEYLNYLTVIKGRSPNTVVEYRTDILMFFSYLKEKRGTQQQEEKYDLSFVDSDFIRSITLNDMYAFISDCQNNKQATAGTRARKIVSIRQFWKYLKTKAKVIENNVSEELETPKIPKRMPKHLSLEKSVRLLIGSLLNTGKLYFFRPQPAQYRIRQDLNHKNRSVLRQFWHKKSVTVVDFCINNGN